jgi:glutaminase
LLLQVKRKERDGTVYSALEIEELTTADPEAFGVSIVTVDGQVLNIGDVNVEFPLMGAVRPLLYALACKDVGISEVGRWIGVEPTAADRETFNLISASGGSHGGGHGAKPADKKEEKKPLLTPDPVQTLKSPVMAHRVQEDAGFITPEPERGAHPRPFNAFLDSGALAMCSLIGRAHYPTPKRLFHDNGSRFSHMLKHFERWCGNRRVGFNNSVFLAQKEKRLKTLAISFYAKGMGVYPTGTDPTETANYLFQAEAVEMNSKDLAVIAATLANIGVCPLTQDRCLDAPVMRSVLSLMYNSGLGPFTGHFMFTAGIPSSAGSSGAHLVVIPGVMGIVIYAPKLNDFAVSQRGVRFCEMLTSKYRVNIFDQLVYSDQAVEINASGRAPAAVTLEQSLMQYELCSAAATGDADKIAELLKCGADPNVADYDIRTALHIACSDGKEEAVGLLLEAGANVLVRDRWGSTPYDDAARKGYNHIVRMLEEHLVSQGHRIPVSAPRADEVSAPAAARFVHSMSAGGLVREESVGSRGAARSASFSPALVTPASGKFSVSPTY